MSAGTTLMKPSLRLHTMTVSSTSGIQRLTQLHRNLRNPTFTKLMNCCTHQNRHKSRIFRNIQYSAVSSSQKKRWISQLPLVRLNECRFVYIPDCVAGRSHSIHSCSSLSYDRSKASSKASSPRSAIQSFLLQMRVFSPFLKVIQ